MRFEHTRLGATTCRDSLAVKIDRPASCSVPLDLVHRAAKVVVALVVSRVPV
jgi:hypothetical protein